MSYQSLYRRYRPKQISEVVAQQHIMEVLVNSIKKDKISHAYLFCGPRGTGKTSIAKLFAKAVNCTDTKNLACGQCENCLNAQSNNHPDIIEIDAASNNGVDEIRGLIERVKYTPISGRFKVYIIDEVHMLSQGAFNALLKTLEEPPSHVVFILATTEIHKVLPTIISRCQRFDFTRIPDEAIEKRLEFILKEENVKAEPGVTKAIANLSGGGLRNALTLLEQAIVLANESITLQQIYESNGLITAQDKKELFDYIVGGDMNSMIQAIKKLQSQSIQFERLMMEIVTDIKDSIILSHTNSKALIELNNIIFIESLSNNLEMNTRLKIIDVVLSYVEKMKFSQQPDMYFDVAMLEIYALVNSMDDSTSSKDTTHSRNTVQPKPQNNQVKVSVPVVNETDQPTLKATDHVENSESESAEEPYNPPLGMQFDLEPIEETTTQNPQPDIKSEIHLPSIANLIEFMVSADKEFRKVDSIKFAEKTRYRNNPKWARPARLLDDASLVLSGEFFVVVASDNDLSVKELLENRNREALFEFSKEIFNSDKVIIPTTTSDFKAAVEQFLIDQKSGNLPQPLSKEKFYSERPTLAVEPVDESLSKLQDLFGDILEVME